jgi:hypothetical protein
LGNRFITAAASISPAFEAYAFDPRQVHARTVAEDQFDRSQWPGNGMLGE